MNLPPLRAAALAGALLAAGAGCPAAAPPPEDPRLAAGRRVGERFCLACHTLDGPASKNPLRPKVRGWTTAQAYANVGQLDRLNAAMIASFEGPDEERWALAAWLARVGSERP